MRRPPLFLAHPWSVGHTQVIQHGSLKCVENEGMPKAANAFFKGHLVFRFRCRARADVQLHMQLSSKIMKQPIQNKKPNLGAPLRPFVFTRTKTPKKVRVEYSILF